MPSHAPTRNPENDALENMKVTGKWVAIMIVVSYVYGDLTVARQLNPDPRQNSWLLMFSPIPTIVSSLLYVAVVTWWGPRYMSTRKPVSGLRPYMMAYNAFQVVMSAWLFWEAGMGGWFGSYAFVCHKCDFSSNPQALRMVRAGYWYLFSKFVDFTDTVDTQPLLILLNTLVHTVMYLYYLLAAMGPRVRPFLWWKKYLTTLQIVQFLVVMFQNTMVFFVECAVPPVLLLWVSSMAVLFLLLFTNFYIKAYRKVGKHQEAMTIPGASSKLSLQTDAATKVVTDMYRAELVRIRTRV